jgi:TraM recognition site of TraD and TraG
MKNFIFRCILITAAITVVELAIPKTTPAQDSTPSWLKPYKWQIWNPQSILLLVVLGGSGYVLMSGSNKKKNQMANARWAGSTEKKAAQRDIVGPILATVLHMIVVRNIVKKRVDPLAVFLDELPTLALPNLVNWLNESRSAGFCGVLGYQNMTQLEKAYGKENSRAILSGCNTKFIFNPGEYESAKYFSDYLGDEEVHYRQKSRSSSKGGSSTSSSDQDKTKKIFSPEEFLKLPAGSCVFINPAYANSNEASVPMKLKVHVGDGEMQRRAYGEAHFNLVIKNLKKRNRHRAIDTNGI